MHEGKGSGGENDVGTEVQGRGVNAGLCMESWSERARGVDVEERRRRRGRIKNGNGLWKGGREGRKRRKEEYKSRKYKDLPLDENKRNKINTK